MCAHILLEVGEFFWNWQDPCFTQLKSQSCSTKMLCLSDGVELSVANDEKFKNEELEVDSGGGQNIILTLVNLYFIFFNCYTLDDSCSALFIHIYTLNIPNNRLNSHCCVCSQFNLSCKEKPQNDLTFAQIA